MPRPKTKDFKTVNFNMDIKVYEKLERYCEETGLTKTAAIERNLDKALTEYFTRATQNDQ